MGIFGYEKLKSMVSKARKVSKEYAIVGGQHQQKQEVLYLVWYALVW